MHIRYNNDVKPVFFYIKTVFQYVSYSCIFKIRFFIKKKIRVPIKCIENC